MGIEAKLNPLEWTWVEMAVDQTVDVVVCMMYSPGEFYCHVLQEDGEWTLLIYFPYRYIGVVITEEEFTQ